MVFEYSQTSTFQAIIITDYVSSFAVFIYFCEDLNIHNGLIGFSSGDHSLFANHPSSFRTNVSLIACTNFPESPWTNVIYELTSKNSNYYNQCTPNNYPFDSSLIPSKRM